MEKSEEAGRESREMERVNTIVNAVQAIEGLKGLLFFNGYLKESDELAESRLDLAARRKRPSAMYVNLLFSGTVTHPTHGNQGQLGPNFMAYGGFRC